VRVLKFGGSSVADAGRMRSVTEIIAAAAAKERVAVVLSAMKGVTDMLISAARGAEAGADSYRQVLETIRTRHFDAARELIAAADQAGVLTPLAIMCNELEEILHGVELIRECSARTMDLLMSFGERLSCLLATAYMRSRGLDAVLVDAREIVFTNDSFGSAAVNFPKSYARIREKLSSFAGIAVVPGFIGATDKGVTTTLGRNGSDYTASIVGGGMEAQEIEIWTDVDGVLSADPRIVPDAFVIPEISYEEAMELSYFGAKVIHPYTMVPAVEKNIPLLIKNSLNPSAPGTRIAAAQATRRDPSRPITGIASIEGISLVNIEGGGMMGIPGFAARTFSALAREGINIIMISQASSEHTICLVFTTSEGERALAALNRELAFELETRRIERFELLRNLLVVSVIGENMHGTPGMAGRLFSALGTAGVNILVIAQGSSERNISFVIEEKNHTLAMRTIHAEFLAGHAARADAARAENARTAPARKAR
jgi:bifunctional aspartokinase / homoserine dehydrogenase 1